MIDYRKMANNFLAIVFVVVVLSIIAYALAYASVSVFSSEISEKEVKKQEVNKSIIIKKFSKYIEETHWNFNKENYSEELDVLEAILKDYNINPKDYYISIYRGRIEKLNEDAILIQLILREYEDFYRKYEWVIIQMEI